LIIFVSIIIITFLSVYFKKITLLSLNKETAYINGIKTELLQLLIYIILAVAVVLGIKVLGIILVSALLIIPIAISKLFASSFKKLIIFSLVFSEIIVISGLFISYYFDLPTGPTIVLTGTTLYTITTVLKLKKTA
jgi:zinc transport system permease protein